MKTAKKRPSKSPPSEVVSARLRKPALSVLKRLYPGQSNQVIIEKLVEERLARRDFDAWIEKLQDANRSGGLDLDKV